MRRRSPLGLLAAPLLVASTCAFGQAGDPTAGFPRKPVRMIVPFPPGGGTPDQFAKIVRTEVDKWAKVIKQTGIHAD